MSSESSVRVGVPFTPPRSYSEKAVSRMVFVAAAFVIFGGFNVIAVLLAALLIVYPLLIVRERLILRPRREETETAALNDAVAQYFPDAPKVQREQWRALMTARKGKAFRFRDDVGGEVRMVRTGRAALAGHTAMAGQPMRPHSARRTEIEVTCRYGDVGLADFDTVMTASGRDPNIARAIAEVRRGYRQGRDSA
ncbi:MULTISPECIES: hypothetical protein [Arthrobacter]|uniref:hypothetical protein n=1 Tax=Arthrobacter TaxID=1663 RepID=UPI001D146AC7|nr:MULTISPECIES: hypothetical protein [Arthrobacter]MCC3282910.1 hypothetical protein [Arthrobacter caoxuetaonis]MCC9192161.1 hypothetical protein [Arthrobacter sp. zg-Y916]